MKKLKRLAASFGCTVEDDKAATAIYVHAPDGMAWEDGSMTSLIEVYGSFGSCLPEWRARAIADITASLHICGRPEDEAEE